MMATAAAHRFYKVGGEWVIKMVLGPPAKVNNLLLFWGKCKAGRVPARGQFSKLHKQKLGKHFASEN